MNFAPFPGHISSAAAMPTIQHFAKLGYADGVQDTRFDGKLRSDVVVVSAPQPTVAIATIPPIHTVNSGVKYQTMSTSSASVNLGNMTYGAQPTFVQDSVLQSVKSDHRAERRDFREDMQHDIMTTMMQQQGGSTLQQAPQQVVVVVHEPKDAAAIARAIRHDGRLPASPNNNEFLSIGEVCEGGTWQCVGGGVAEYLTGLHHLLKYSAPPTAATAPVNVNVTVKREHTPVITNTLTQEPSPQPTSTETSVVVLNERTVVAPMDPEHQVNVATNTNTAAVKKKKKKVVKEKKQRPRPGEIRLTTALDGSTLYCCPECHMAYPERGLLDQHLLGHTMERRFICDVCHAALKRKDHLTRHKQSHSAERPHVCALCLKAFKRKEQLALHCVTHSGEKRHVCNECGKGFYRKDHLRKHTRCHIARRVKAELCAGGEDPPTGEGGHAPLPPPVPAPQPPPQQNKPDLLMLIAAAKDAF